MNPYEPPRTVGNRERNILLLPMLAWVGFSVLLGITIGCLTSIFIWTSYFGRDRMYGGVYVENLAMLTTFGGIGAGILATIATIIVWFVYQRRWLTAKRQRDLARQRITSG